MPRTKIALSLDAAVLDQVDRLVAAGAYPNRSRAVEHAVTETLARLEADAFARECAKLDPEFEKKLAEEGLALDAAAWPES
jgi:Arc/MetJ-type ribon-helix-helix transcriptional regulator